jgi:hypothetical protein
VNHIVPSPSTATPYPTTTAGPPVEGGIYHYNHLGSVELITDGNGSPVEYIRYKPYGEPRGRWHYDQYGQLQPVDMCVDAHCSATGPSDRPKDVLPAGERSCQSSRLSKPVKSMIRTTALFLLAFTAYQGAVNPREPPPYEPPPFDAERAAQAIGKLEGKEP